MLRKILPSELLPDMRVESVVFRNGSEAKLADSSERPSSIAPMNVTAFWVEDGMPDNEFLAKEISKESLAAPLAPASAGHDGSLATAAFEQTFLSAGALRTKAAIILRQCFDSVKKGEAPPLRHVSEVVEEIVSNVEQNQDAMLAMRGLLGPEFYSLHHNFNVATLVVAFGKFLGYSHRQLFYLGLAGFLHDVGKEFIPQSIINAPRQLDAQEALLIQQHSELGFQHLENIDELPEIVLKGILEHHEKADGGGYPNGLTAEQISPFAAIIALADMYDALSSNRPYRAALPATQALALVYSLRGKAFLPSLAERFISCVGVYPAGSLVSLSSGDIAVVQKARSKDSDSKIIVVPGNKNRHGILQLIDLTLMSNTRIMGSLDPLEHGIDCQAILQRAF